MSVTKFSRNLNSLRNFNVIFRKDVLYNNINIHKKPGLYPLSKKYSFGKTTEGFELTLSQKDRL